MIRLPALFCCAVLALFSLSGCVPGEDDHVDETRDPNFQRGRALAQGQDFRGAADEFEKAIEVNPRSAAAHFELAWICEEKTRNYAEAIYHYEKHLALRPNSEYSDRAKAHIQVCKRELAKAEFAPPSTMALQHEIERLNAENLILRQNLDSMRTQMAGMLAAQSHAPSQPPTDTGSATPVMQARSTLPPSPVPTRTVPVAVEATHLTSPEAGAGQPIHPNPNTNTVSLQGGSTNPKTHAVKSGETMASIASQYHVRLNGLLQANPNVNPKKLKVGQTLNLPTQ